MISYREIRVEEKQQLKELIDTVLGNLERKEFFIPFTEQDLEDMFNKNKVITYGAYDEEKLVGTAQLFFDESYTAEIKEILNIDSNKIAEFGGYLVLKEYRNKGIMKHLENMLILEDCFVQGYRILQPERNNTRGSLCVDRVKELPIILEFTSFQDTIMFHKRGRFGIEKVQNSEINVKVVLEYRLSTVGRYMKFIK